METTTNTKLAFLGDSAIKSRLVEAIKADQAADAIVQGEYMRTAGNAVGFQGCAVGCAVAAFRGTKDQFDWHAALEDETGIPEQINYVIDGLFERQADQATAAQFTLDVFSAIQPGADLSLVISKLMLDVLVGEPYGLSKLPDLAEAVAGAVEKIAECYRRRLAGDEPSETEWQAAGDDARDAWAAYVPWVSARLIEHLSNASFPGTN